MLSLFYCKTPHKVKNMYTQQQPVRAQHEAKNGPKKKNLYMKEITLKPAIIFFPRDSKVKHFPVSTGSTLYWHQARYERIML